MADKCRGSSRRCANRASDERPQMRRPPSPWPAYGRVGSAERAGTCRALTGRRYSEAEEVERLRLAKTCPLLTNRRCYFEHAQAATTSQRFFLLRFVKRDVHEFHQTKVRRRWLIRQVSRCRGAAD